MRPHIIPGPKEWEGWESDPDVRYAHRLLYGKSIQEVMPDFARNTIERTDELRFMPAGAFQYYVFALVDYLLSRKLEDRDDDEYWFYISQASSGADCLLGLILWRLQDDAESILPIMEDLLPAVDYVTAHQMQFQCDEDIFGNFSEKRDEILECYQALSQQPR